MKNIESEYFAITAPGLESVCGEELVALHCRNVVVSSGGVAFTGGLKELYLANLYLRTATRVLVRVGSFKSTDFPELFRKSIRLPWGSFLRSDTAINVRASSHRSRLIHTGRIAETIQSSVDHVLARSSMPAEDAEHCQQIYVRIEDDLCTLSCDSSGELLHKRGYRQTSGAAPLRETLAAASLLMLGWDGTIPLCDPLCGSGTIVIEGALIATGRPPGRYRSFAFMQWPGYRYGLWETLIRETDQKIRPCHSKILASDQDLQICAAAKENAARAGVEAEVEISHSELQRLPVRNEGGGLVFCNPPYGQRLQSHKEISQFYRDMGHSFRQKFPGWKVAFIAPEEDFVRACGLELSVFARLTNGGIRVALYTAQIPASA